MRGLLLKLLVTNVKKSWHASLLRAFNRSVVKGFQPFLDTCARGVRLLPMHLLMEAIS